MVIAHNLAAMNTQRMYGITTSEKKKTTEKLSSGYKINRAADDAAGLTISEKMRSQIRGLNQGSDNIQDGVSVVQIADGALAEVNDMLHRMTELSIKSANGTNTDADRAAIQKEIHEIIQEIDRIHESTEFNTMKLFDGEVAKSGDGPVADIGPIKCASTDKGDMIEDYNSHPAAIVDFGGINATNIGDLTGKYFSFQCTQGCGEMFKFTFINDGTGSKLKSDSTSLHDFEIDITGLSSGADLVDAIYGAAEDAYNIAKYNNEHGTNNPGGLKYKGGFNNIEGSLTYGVPVGHANGMDKKDANSLAIYGYSYNPKQFINSTSGTAGRVDTKGIIPPPDVLGEMKEIWIQCSGTQGDGLKIEIEKMNAKYIGIDKIDVSTEGGARNAIEKVAAASAHISAMRSDLGAYQNRLEHAYVNNQNKAENTTAAESRIRDTDMAAEMVRLSMQNILQQAGESMLAQANQSTQGVLSLLS